MGFYLNKGILNYLIYFSLQILFITMMDFDPSANSKEYLWSTKLTKKSNKTQWEGRDDGVLEQLVLKRACLGVGAKENERNIVQVTSFNYQQKKVMDSQMSPYSLQQFSSLWKVVDQFT